MAIAKKAKTKTEPTNTAQKFPLEVLIKAKVFANYKDALGAIINPGEALSVAQAQERLDEFLKEVKN